MTYNNLETLIFEIKFHILISYTQASLILLQKYLSHLKHDIKYIVYLFDKP